ncbi:glycosyltransferase family 2 protein [Paludibaculum fermentans]|uniref:Glycosyltransferase family 2 protein n=1 Tax=Paludibaculum fermentans TaxID=1473598 RepID=A0A7S7NQ91_PALFE|nr:glycosyltransferase family 2 protein [Paludibaculum fermentans]QOY87750.1 glycosyltransferase family 2 protein [Paludibaculum fermentans]
MKPGRVTVVVPTLAGDRRLLDCLASLEGQTLPEVTVVVVDNSGCGRIHTTGAARYRFRLIENKANVGFGAAVNQGFWLAPAEYMAVLNDDAVAEPCWLEEMVKALDVSPKAGMAAGRIRLAGTGRLDSAGMLMAGDGSSKQRGHGTADDGFAEAGEALLPSGCAAVYRREMLDEAGLFEEDFFLYCEDTDLGLRGRWAGWHCLYVPTALVDHAYSQSSGAASARKAWFVERNRLRLAVRCLPLSSLLAAPFYAIVRYFWHAAGLFTGQGKAAEFRTAGGSGLQLPWLVLKAHLDLVRHLPTLLRQRARIASTRRISVAEFKQVLKRHSIKVREVAAL